MSTSENEIEALFKQYEETHELAYHLEDFIANCIAIGKDVRMDAILKQIKLVLRKALKGPLKYENCLQFLSRVSSTNPEMLIGGEMPRLILKVFEKTISLKCNDQQESRRLSVIFCVLETATAISDASEEGKLAVADFVPPCLELLAHKEEHLTARLEANRLLNIIIQSYPKKKLGSVPFVKNFDDLLANAGDLELQLCMTELICRVLPYESRQVHVQKWFPLNPESRDDFLSIRDMEFESDSRKFVNNLNEKQLESRSVYSVLCKEVYLGLQKVECPNDDGSDGKFWTDFNLGSKSITFFAINEKNDVWETVTLKEDSIVQTQISEKRESHEVVLLLQLNIPACTLLSYLQQRDEKYVKFIYDENNGPLTPASLLFPKYFESIAPVSPDVIASTPKASVTSNAVHFSSRAKGLSKTVSLLTPRRRKGKGESSDDSSNPNVAASSKENEIEKPLSKNKEASSRDTKDEDTTLDDDNKEQRSCTTGDRNSDRKPEKAVLSVDVSRDKGSRVQTRSSQSIDAGKHNDQNQRVQQCQSLDNTYQVKDGRDNRSLGESGLGKSIDSGLGKSIDNHLDSRSVKDMSLDEPTIIHETQALSQGGVDDKDHLDDHVLSSVKDDEPLSVIAKSRRVSKDGKDAKKTGDGEDSSSGPFTKANATVKKPSTKKTTEIEKDDGESSTTFVKKPIKPIKGKATAKTRQIRTRAAAKKNASIGRSTSTSESEVLEKVLQTKAKAMGVEPSALKALTRSHSEDNFDKRNKLGSGYNTEDWMMGHSEPERRTKKKKALENVQNAPQPRLSLLNTVYRENLTWDSKRKRAKLAGPWEFRCSPPAKRNPQCRILVRTPEKIYELKKKEELRKKREKKGIVPKKPMSRKDFKEMKDKEKSFSDIALEVQQNYENQLRKNQSESDVLNRAGESEKQSMTAVLSDDEEKSRKTRKNSEKDTEQIPAQIPLSSPPADDVCESLFNFDDQQISADRAAEPDENLLDGDSLSNLVKGFLDTSTGTEAIVDKHATGTEDQTEKGDTRETKDQEIFNDEESKKVMEEGVEKDGESSRKSLRETKANFYSKYFPKKPMSTDRPREIENSLNDVDNDTFGPDDEGEPQRVQTKEIRKNKKHVDVSEIGSQTKSRTNSNQETPAKKSTTEKASTYQTRGKQMRKNEESTELGNKAGFFTRPMGEQPSDGIQTEKAKWKAAEESDDGSLSTDTALILDAFRKSSERIIEDSDDCMDRPTSVRKQSETISRNKMRMKSVNNRRGSVIREEHFYHLEDEMNVKPNTPKVNFSRSADSGFFDKTPSFSSKKRTYDKRGETPGSAKSDVREETPGGKVLRKSQRFGRLNVQSTSSRTPTRGYQSNEDKQSFRLQEEHESPDEDYIVAHSQPASGDQVLNKGSRKRKGSGDIGFKSGSFLLRSDVQKRKKSSLKHDDFEDQDSTVEDANVNNSLKTPVDRQSLPIQPRKLFQSSDHSSAKKRRKVSREGLSDDNNDGGDDDDDDIEDELDEELSIGEKMQTSFENFGKEVRKSIKQRQNYVSQMTSVTMELITNKSDEMWSKRTSRRHAIMNEFTNRVNRYVDEHQQIANRSQEIENEMFSQVNNHMKDLVEQRKAQEECLQRILKTKKALAEAFKSMEVAEQAQQMDFHNSLQKELKRYRDQTAKEVQKQEFENIKRRIQAMLGMSL